MPISFNQIPASLRTPFFFAEVDNSQASFFQLEGKCLIIGQKLAAGIGAAETLLLVTSTDQAKSLFGVGSILARMVEFFRKNDPFSEVWCIAQDDAGASAAATGTIAITGSATANGTVFLYLAGQRIQVGVTSGDTATVVGAAVAAAVNADTNLPVTAANVTGTVTFTARNKGTVGNTLDIRLNYQGDIGGESTPAGLTITPTQMASGATDPTLANTIAAMADERFDLVVTPYTDTTSLNLLQTEMDDTTGRWSPGRELYGHVVGAKEDTVSNLSTFGNARNDQHASIMGYNDSPTPPHEWAGAIAGQALRQFVDSDKVGRPLQTLPLIGVLPPPKSSQFIQTERNTLLFDGIATSYVSGGFVRIERLVTTYQLNAFSQPDPSYLDSITLAQLAFINRLAKQRITTKFPRHKVANNGTRFGEGQAIITPNIIFSEMIAITSELEFLGIVENTEATKATTIVERDAGDPNRINVLWTPDLVNQLRVFALKNQFRLQFNTAETQAAA